MDRTIVLRRDSNAHQLWEVLKQWRAFAAAGRFLRVRLSDVEDKSRDQECKYHAMLKDISKACIFMGQKQDQETWKRLMVDLFAKEVKGTDLELSGHGRLIPAYDGDGVVQLGFQTRNFNLKQGAAFIEFLYAFGAEHNVKWSDEPVKEAA